MHFAATLSFGGTIVFLVVAAEPGLRHARPEPRGADTLRRRLGLIAWISLGLAAISGVLWFLLTAQAMSGSSFGRVLSDGSVWIVLTRTEFGHIAIVRAAIAALLAAILFARRHAESNSLENWLLKLLFILGAAFSVTIAWTGHAVADEGIDGVIHLAADGMHLLAATAWLGGLIPLVLLLSTARINGTPEWTSAARTATVRFSATGIICVAALLASGIVNAWYLAGNIPVLIGTRYGRLLLAKIALFLAMATVAAVNRFKLMPRLSHVPRGSRARASQDAIRQLVRNACIEAALGLAAVSVAGLLGTLVPGLHTEPVWPLPFRFAPELLSLPDIGTTVELHAIGLVVGLALMGTTFAPEWLGSWRWPIFSLGMLISFYSVVHMGDLIVPAYPTSFSASPTGYTATSILDGRDAFAKNCVACHGDGGHGDGPLAKTLPIPPADLTAAHIYDHLDGELFWWISHGMGNVMPGFAPVLSERQRWDLIDFVHANADAVRFAASVPKPAAQYIRAPNFAAQCPGGSTVTIQRLAGRIVHIVFARTASSDRMRQLANLDLVGGDVTTIVAVNDETPFEARKFCVAAAAGIAETYAPYLGNDKSLPDGAEFIVDAAGSLRAGWYPGLDPDTADDWRRPSAIRGVVEQIRRNPLAPPAASTAHVHSQ